MGRADVLELLQKAIGKDKVLSGEQLDGRYHHIWHMNEPLIVRAILLPADTNDISAILKICHGYNQPIVIFGGLTGLVGATRCGEKDIILSLEKINSIEETDTQGRCITVGAGVILEEIQLRAYDNGLFFPLNFGAKGSAQIGGILSTNAGGIRVLRYGMVRNSVLGIEAVLPDGTVIDSLRKLTKDNSGYDLKQLFIGSEGTLGVISRVVLKLYEKPNFHISAFISLRDYNSVIELLRHMDRCLEGQLSSFELLSPETYKKMTSGRSRINPPLPYGSRYYVLLDYLSNEPSTATVKFEDAIAKALDSDIIEDAAIASTDSENKWFWALREDIDTLIDGNTFLQTFDISIPIHAIGTTTDIILENLSKEDGVISSYMFGHAGDGNIHFIIDKSHQEADLTKKINDIVYSPLKALKGSISAEHGIGLDKKSYLEYSRTQEEIELMKTIKRAVDPKNILNPGRIFDLNTDEMYL